MTELRTIRVGMEWAHIVTDEETGLFVAHGSYGTFAHAWPPQWRGKPLLPFLAELHFDYFMGKTRGRAAEQFDCAATRRRMKEWIIDFRRQGEASKEEARAAWNGLEVIDDTDSVDLFMTWVSEDDDLLSVLGSDFYEAARRCPAPDCAGFWNTIWPAFLEEIEKPAEVAA